MFFNFPMRSPLLSLRLVSLGLLTLSAVMLGTPYAIAADWVVLKYSILRESISVLELTTLAETGEVSPSLRSYLRLAKRDPQDVRQTLTREIRVNPLFLDRVLNSPVGEYFLDQLSDVIHTPSGGASRQSLRGALMSSALPDGNITLIEVLQNYPTSEVHVEGDRLAEAYRRLSQLGKRLPKF